MEGNLNIKGLNMNTQGMKKSEDCAFFCTLITQVKL